MIRGVVSRRESLLHAPERGFSLIETEAVLWLPNDEQVTIHRPGFHTGDGVTIIPYFKHSQTGEWLVVMVSQFRPNVEEVCLEAPGSLLESGFSPREQMVKVVREEAGITVAENLITILAVSYIANSFCDQKVWIGAVELEVTDVEGFRATLHGRSDPESDLEVTEVSIHRLADLIRHRHLMVSYDLTCRQLFELGLHLGLCTLAITS